MVSRLYQLPVMICYLYSSICTIKKKTLEGILLVDKILQVTQIKKSQSSDS